MKILHNNILTEKLPLAEAKTSEGIYLPTKPVQHYKVVKCGPKVKGIEPGYVIKPFQNMKGQDFNFEGIHYVVFNTDQVDDIISTS